MILHNRPYNKICLYSDIFYRPIIRKNNDCAIYMLSLIYGIFKL